jgi:phage terminase large subunit-like protein
VSLDSPGGQIPIWRLDALEDEMVSWQPETSSWSPNRVDALVWVLTELMTFSIGRYTASEAALL